MKNEIPGPGPGPGKIIKLSFGASTLAALRRFLPRLKKKAPAGAKKKEKKKIVFWIFVFF